MLHLSCHGNGAQWEVKCGVIAARSDTGVLKKTQIIEVRRKQLFLSNLIVLQCHFNIPRFPYHWSVWKIKFHIAHRHFLDFGSDTTISLQMKEQAYYSWNTSWKQSWPLWTFRTFSLWKHTLPRYPVHLVCILTMSISIVWLHHFHLISSNCTLCDGMEIIF